MVPGTSEEFIAEALYSYRPGLIIAINGRLEHPRPRINGRNASPKHLTEAREGSLKCLRVDRIAVSFETSAEALAKLGEEGKIRDVALSVRDASTMRRLLLTHTKFSQLLGIGFIGCQ
jgi:aryl-alcohol dehydrogenase-like predicted oxidoreductase